MILGGNLFWGKCNSSLDEGNLVLGMQFRTCENFGERADSSLVLSPKFSQIQKPHRNSQNLQAKRSNHHFDCDSLCESTANQAKNAESTLDSAISQNLVKKELCEAPENSPASWCKKSDSRLQKCNRRFFARSGESEALPLKAKKRSFLARRGSGAGGAALFAKKTRELNSQKNDDFAESSKDYIDSQNLKSGLPRRFCESARNDGNNRIA